MFKHRDNFAFSLPGHTVFWMEDLKGRDHSEDIGLDGKIILKWILGNKKGKMRTGCRLMADHCEHYNQPSGSIRKNDIFLKS